MACLLWLCAVIAACPVALPAWAGDDPAGLPTVVAAIPGPFPPIYVTGANGEPSGFGVETFNAIAHEGGLRVRYRVTNGWEEAYHALQGGEADVIPNVGITQARSAWMDFTAPVETYSLRIFVRTNTQDIRGPADLAGRRVGAVKSNVGAGLLAQRKDLKLSVYDDGPSALFGLLSGQIDALVYPRPILLKLAQEADVRDKIKTVGPPLLEIKRAIGVRKDHPELLARLNASVERYIQSEAYRSAYRQWFGAQEPFWNVRHILWATGFFFSCTIILMALWRYRSLRGVNRRLSSLVKEYEASANNLAAFRRLTQAVLDHAPALISVRDLHGTVILANRNFDTLDLPRADRIEGRNLFEIFPKGEAEALWRNNEAALHARGPVETEETIRHRDGGDHIYLTVTFPLYGKTHEPFGTCAISTDITERKKAEAKLRANELFLRTVLDTMPVGVWITDETGRIIRANPAAQKIWGGAELVGTEDSSRYKGRWLKTGEPLGPDEWGAVRAVRRGETSMEEEIAIEAFDGTHKIILHSALPFYGQAGDLKGAIVVCQDITDRKKAEAELRRTNRALRTLSKVNAALVRTTEEDELMQEVCRIVVEEGEYRMAWVGFAEDDEAKTVRPVAWDGADNGYVRQLNVTWAETERGHGPTGRAIRSGEPVFVRDIEADPKFAPWRGAARSRGFRSAIAVPLVADSRTFGALNIYAAEPDAFDRHEIELLTEMAQNLAYGIRAVRTRTAHAQAEEEKRQLRTSLRQAQKMEAIGTLAGGIAHDFNNILSAIIGYADIATIEVPEGSAAASDLDQIKVAGRRAAELVKQILTFSRRSEQLRQPVQIQFIIKEALKLLRATIPTNIDIRQDIDVACGPVLADPSEVHQILMNLSANASYAMREKGGTLRIRLARVSVKEGERLDRLAIGPGKYVVLEASDTGCGMDEATMERIFDPYFTTKEKGEGTGLGLAVVHGIVAASGGHVTVESTPGAGATFRIFFPELPKDALCTMPSRRATPLGQGEHILAVDDEPSLARMLEKGLACLGYKVTSFHNSAEALSACEAAPGAFDLVLTDLYMPKMTGLDLARRIHALRPDVPILLQTGLKAAVKPEDAKAAGIRTIVSKPANWDDLAGHIQAVLGGKTGPAPEDSPPAG